MREGGRLKKREIERERKGIENYIPTINMNTPCTMDIFPFLLSGEIHEGGGNTEAKISREYWRTNEIEWPTINLSTDLIMLFNTHREKTYRDMPDFNLLCLRRITADYINNVHFVYIFNVN